MVGMVGMVGWWFDWSVVYNLDVWGRNVVYFPEANSSFSLENLRMVYQKSSTNGVVFLYVAIFQLGMVQFFDPDVSLSFDLQIDTAIPI